MAILGSMIALLFAAFMAASPFIATAQPQPPNSAQIAVVGAAITAALAGLGIWTAIGVFRLRSWARTSILIFAGFLGAWSAIVLLVTMVIPLPREITGGAGQSFRSIMELMFGIPLAIAVWWLIQFNARSTKAEQNQPSPIPFDQGILMYLTVGFSTILAAVAIYFLMRNRPAFVRADS